MPRYSTRFEANSHFERRRWRSNSSILARTRLVRSSWVLASGEKIRRSSIYVHESLERGRGIGHPEEHYERLEKSSVCGEGTFPLMSVLDSDIVVSPPDIEFSEEFSSLELINEVGDEGEGIGIADSMLVKVPIVLTGA